MYDEMYGEKYEVNSDIHLTKEEGFIPSIIVNHNEESATIIEVKILKQTLTIVVPPEYESGIIDIYLT